MKSGANVGKILIAIHVPNAGIKNQRKVLFLNVVFRVLKKGIAVSASLEMCMVAIGALDYYFVGKEILRVVDIAASTLIVQEAGGFVKTMSGEDLDMGFNLEERTSVLAACSEKLIADLLFKA